jgi:hypothetical protein
MKEFRQLLLDPERAKFQRIAFPIVLSERDTVAGHSADNPVHRTA